MDWLNKDYIGRLVDLGRSVTSGNQYGNRLDSDLAIVRSGAWRANLKRMMDELVDSQFADPTLAIRENVQNARDARPREGIYVGIDENAVYLIDDGIGMDETDINEHLLGLFDSSKCGDDDAI